MAKKDPLSSDLKKIASNTLARSMSLFGLTVTSGAKFAGLKLGDMFRTQTERDQRFEQFLSEQASVLAEELGKLKGSIMKAGQMLSVYGEHFLPAEVNRVLKTLQSESRPVIWEEMEKVLTQQLGKEKLAKLEIDKKPIAAASMGQVYQAKETASGKMLALKVQYPGVDKAIDSDLKALRSILSITSLVPMTPSFEDIFKEIRMMLHYEADYQRELATVLTYREKLKDDPRFIIPEVYSDYSSNRVLAMSLESGMAVDSLEVLGLSQKRRNQIGCALMDLMFKEIFEWRMVQTDPHLGNYRIKLGADREADKIILFDFGAVRTFPKKYIDPFCELVYSALTSDREGVIKSGQKLGFLYPDDKAHVLDLFVHICFMAIEGFSKTYESPSLDGSDAGKNPYDWRGEDLMKRLTSHAKDAVFAFKLRTPPREAIFLDRKMVGTYIFATVIGMKFGPRKLILKYTSREDLQL